MVEATVNIEEWALRLNKELTEARTCIAALEAQIEQVTKKLNLAIAERDFWRAADVNSQKQLFECKQSLVTPPAPKVTETALPQDVIDLVIAAREFWDANDDLSPESRALDSALEEFSSRVPYAEEPDALTAAQESGQ